MGDTGGDHDLYDYCGDDPVSMSDPTGLNPRLFGAFLQELAENAMRVFAPALAKRAALLAGAGGLFIASSIAGGISRKAGHPNPGAATEGVAKGISMAGKIVEEGIGAIADPVVSKVFPGNRRVPEGMQTARKRRQPL